MPHRPANRRFGNRKRDGLLETILAAKPAGGEDFFVFSIVTDGDEPTWEARMTFAGAYHQAAVCCVRALSSMAEAKQLKSARIALYEGPAARAYLAEAVIQERRYQDERQGQPNN